MQSVIATKRKLETSETLYAEDENNNNAQPDANKKMRLEVAQIQFDSSSLTEEEVEIASVVKLLPPDHQNVLEKVEQKLMGSLGQEE